MFAVLFQFEGNAGVTNAVRNEIIDNDSEIAGLIDIWAIDNFVTAFHLYFGGGGISSSDSALVDHKNYAGICLRFNVVGEAALNALTAFAARLITPVVFRKGGLA